MTLKMGMKGHFVMDSYMFYVWEVPMYPFFES